MPSCYTRPLQGDTVLFPRKQRGFGTAAIGLPWSSLQGGGSAMAKKKVFLSYRRDDAAGFAHAIHERLVDCLPKGRVFMDVHGIETGTDFVRNLEAALDECSVLVVLIGKRWAGGDQAGAPRLQDPRDWVRIEVLTALRRGIKVIPVLLDGATMPSESSLPDELRPLLRFIATEVRTSRITADLWDLAGTIMKSLGETWPPPAPGGLIYAVTSGSYAFFAGAAVLLLLIASLFETTNSAAALGIGLFVMNALIVLRLPLHQKIHSLTRHRALRVGAALHLAAFGVLMLGDSSMDGVVIFLFGLVPSALLFLAAFAMEQRAPTAPLPAGSARAHVVP